MLNTTKALIVALIISLSVLIVVAVWLATPQHSGVAMSTLLCLIVVDGLLVGWLFDTPRAY